MRAVVLGAGIAGICAAAALAGAGHEVTVLERDQPGTGDDAVRRPGAPQGRQLHNLLGRGQLHLAELLPGFLDRLLDAGAVAADVSRDTHVFELGVRMPERSCGLQLISAPRPVIERVARSLLPSEVTVRAGIRALGLEAGTDGVAGVHTDAGYWPCDLLVDATGAGSQLPQWLSVAGAPAPEVTTFQVRQWYCTLVFRRPPPWVNRPDFWLTFATYPNTRSGLISPFGSDLWYVSVSGQLSDPAPRTATEFVRYVATLEDSALAEALIGAEPIGEPSIFGRPIASWRHYERGEHPVPGVLAIGDAVAPLNPLLGQGISVAAWQAAGLAAALAAPGSEPDLDQIGRDYYANLAHATGAAWALTTIFDPVAASSVDVGPVDWARVAAAVGQDGSVHRRYVRIWHLLEPASTLAEISRTGEVGR